MNSTTSNLKFDHGGPSSKAIYKAAGNQIQKECSFKYRKAIKLGDVAITGPGYLDCSYIFHVWIPSWKNSNDDKNIEATVIACLNEAERLKQDSIAFPALGTGGLNYEPKTVAQTLFNAVDIFNKQNPETIIRLVICVVFHDDMYKKFVTEARNRARERVHESMKLITTDPIKTECGSGKIKVFVGNLVAQQVDVIVYTCPHDLQLGQTAGLVADVLDAAGKSIQQELDKKYPNGVDIGTFAVTNSYGLKCKKVYHGCVKPFSANGENNPKTIMKTFIRNCLSEANRYNCRSIGFPALGTGQLQFPSEISASLLLKAVLKFLRNNSQTSICDIRIIIFGGNNDWSSIEKAYRSELSKAEGFQIAKTVGIAIPKKGTHKYLRYKSDEVLTPPSNWSVYTFDKTIKEWIATGNTKSVTIKPDSSTFNSVKDVFMKTIKLKGVQVVSIQRNENIIIYERYAQDCQRIYGRAITKGSCKSLENTPGSSGPALSMNYVNRQMARQLDNTINEVYLFHGTKRDRVTVLLQNGFDQRLSTMNFDALKLGTGIYTAEESFLSAKYTDDEGERCMFVMRVCLGDVFTTRDQNTDLRRPPCKEMCNKICVNHDEVFDSVLGEFNPREFVVYDGAKCYPEYLIKYRVVKATQKKKRQ